ncbi:MAG: hypothetical protein GY943_32685, partial [Chloroflexi bacterium]|nr:hypothetical protein [Chloroflexota bacterium]
MYRFLAEKFKKEEFIEIAFLLEKDLEDITTAERISVMSIELILFCRRCNLSKKLINVVRELRPKDVNDPRLKEFERKESEHDVVHTATLERQNEQALLDKMREIDFIDA